MNDWILRELELMLLTAVLIFGAVGIAKAFGRKLGYRWRKLLWLLIAIRLVIPAYSIEEYFEHRRVAEKEVEQSIEISLPIVQPEWNRTSQVIVLNDVVVDIEVNKEGVIAERNLWEIGKSFFARYGQQILVVIWGIGAVLFIGMGAIQYLFCKRRYLKHAVVCTDEQVITLWQKSCSKKAPEIQICEQISSPMLMGYGKTVLLLPNTSYSEQELLMMFRHEAMHYQKKDLWYKLFLSIVCDLYWFNPMFRYMKKLAFQDVEYVCDELVTRDMNKEERYSYGQIILKTMTQTWLDATAYTTQFAAGKKTAKNRLGLLFTGKHRKIGFAIAAVLVLGIVGIGMRVSFVWQEEDVHDGEVQQVTVDEVEKTESNSMIESTELSTEEPVALVEEYISEEEMRLVSIGDLVLTCPINWAMKTTSGEDDSSILFQREHFSLQLTHGEAWRAYFDMSHQEYADMIKEWYQDFMLESIEDITLDGLPARKTVFTYQNEEGQLIAVEQYSVVYGYAWCELEFSYLAKLPEKYVDSVEQTIASVRFFEQKEQKENPYSYRAIMAGEQIYYCTGEEVVMGDAGNVEGYIESSTENVMQNGQVNFEGVGNPYTYDFGDGIRDVFMDDTYYRFQMLEWDYQKLIAGDWTLDWGRTEHELNKFDHSIQELYGTGMTLGKISIGEEGEFAYYYGIGNGGEGCYKYDDGMITAMVLPYENHMSELYEVSKWMRKIEDGTEYLVRVQEEGNLYFVREHVEAKEVDWVIEEANSTAQNIRFTNGIELVLPDVWAEYAMIKIDNESEKVTRIAFYEKQNVEAGEVGYLGSLEFIRSDYVSPVYYIFIDEVLGKYKVGDFEYALLLSPCREGGVYSETDEKLINAYRELYDSMEAVQIKTEHMKGFEACGIEEIAWIEYI